MKKKYIFITLLVFVLFVLQATSLVASATVYTPTLSTNTITINGIELALSDAKFTNGCTDYSAILGSYEELSGANATVEIADGTITVKMKSLDRYHAKDWKGAHENFLTTFKITVTIPAGYEVKCTGYSQALTGTIELSATTKNMKTSGSSGGWLAEEVFSWTFSDLKAVSPDVTFLTPFVAGGNISADISYADGTTNLDFSQNNTLQSVSAMTVSVSPTSQYCFVGWLIDDANDAEDDPWIFSRVSEGAVVIPNGKWNIRPCFVLATAATYSVAGVQYRCLDDANFNAVQSGQPIILVASGAVYGTLNQDVLEISSGVVFILPYAQTAAAYVINEAPPFSGIPEYWPYANVSNNRTTSNLNPESAYITLTLPQGKTIDVSGKLCVGGTVTGKQGQFTGGTVGTAFAKFVLSESSSLNLLDDSVLSVCGYITGQGVVNAQNTSAKIFQPLTFADFNGASYMVGAGAYVANSRYGIDPSTTPGGESIFPLMMHSVRNIQVEMKVGASASVTGYVLLQPDSSDTPYFSTVDLVSANGLIRLEDAVIISTYDSTQFVSTLARSQIGRTKLKIEGQSDSDGDGYVGATFGNLVLNVKVNVVISTISLNIDSAKMAFPVPYNYDIELSNGTYYINNDLTLYPGAELTVASDATMIVNAELCVFDGLYDHKFLTNYTSENITSSGTYTVAETTYYDYPVMNQYPSYPKDSDLRSSTFHENGMANLYIDGILKITSEGEFGGIVQTSGTGTIDLSEADGSKLIASQQVGVIGENYSTGISTKNCAPATLHTFTARAYIGDVLEELSAGMIYSGIASEHSLAGYSYQYFNDISNPTTPVVAVVNGTDTVFFREFATIDSVSTAAVSGSWYTLRVHSNTTRNEGTAINTQYRLKDYLWLNALCYFDSSFTPATEGTITVTTYNADGTTDENTYSNGVSTTEDGVQVVVVDSVVYLVKAIPAKEIPDSITFSISYNDGTNTYTSVKFTVSLAAYDAGDDETLKQALLTYGDAAKDYSDDNTTLETGHSVTKNPVDGGAKVSSTGKPQSWNGATLETTGANVYFDEALRLGISYQLSAVPEGYEIVQVGLLVGDSDNANLLLENATKAYLLCDTLNGITVDGVTISNKTLSGAAEDNRPWDKDDKVINVPPDSLVQPTDLTSGTIIFDLAMQDYKTMFALRPAIVLKSGDTYVCVYGRQIGYGLEAYINGVYDTTTSDEYKYLLEQTWALATAING